MEENKPYLELLIDSKGFKKTVIADKCGISISSFYNKLKKKTPWTEQEATILCEELGITTLQERKKAFS